MTLPLTARKEAADQPCRRPLEPVMTFTGEGLILGGTLLAPLRSERQGAPEIAVDGAEERILALLAVAYGKTVQPGVLGNIRRAARYWHRGEDNLAAIEIALGNPPPLAHKERNTARLLLGEQLLAEGLSPRELVKLCGLDPASLNFLKTGYNPDQPRAPAGSPEGGQWTSEGDDAGSSTPNGGRPSSVAGGSSARGITQVDPNIEFVGYTPVHGLPSDAVVVTTPDGRTIADRDSDTKKLMAPPRADYQKVYAAGRSIASLPLPEQYSEGRTAIAQGGTYDFQRDVKQQKFYDAYTHAANYAVGVYMSGAGYSLSATLIFAKLLRSAKFKQLRRAGPTGLDKTGVERRRGRYLEVGGRALRMTIASRRMLKRAIQGAALVALAISAFYVIRFVVVAAMWVNILSSRDFMDASAKNERGDVASAETNFFGAPEHRVKTVIRLKRTGHWFSTTLVEARTWEVLVGLKWAENDTLEVQLDFGCQPQMERPVTAVGPIHIVYHWGDPGHIPKGGYETFRRRDLPPEPCP